MYEDLPFLGLSSLASSVSEVAPSPTAIFRSLIRNGKPRESEPLITARQDRSSGPQHSRIKNVTSLTSDGLEILKLTSSSNYFLSKVDFFYLCSFSKGKTTHKSKRLVFRGSRECQALLVLIVVIRWGKGH